MNLREDIKKHVRQSALDKPQCLYCVFLYELDPNTNDPTEIIVDENGEPLLDCWYDDCSVMVLPPGAWCEEGCDHIDDPVSMNERYLASRLKLKLNEADEFQKRQDALTPGKNPDAFYGDAFKTMRDKIDRNELELGSMEDDMESIHDLDQNETLNTILDRLDYVEELNADMLDFLHNLVDVLKDDDKYRDMAREFTVLLNRGGRRKFYQQSTNRL